MHDCKAALAPPGQQRPRFEVADIFRQHGQAYQDSHALTSGQRRVMRDIEACRTAVLGGHVDECPECGLQSAPSYNSCGNRHCPKCQCLRQAAWVEQRMRRILPTSYFHAGPQQVFSYLGRYTHRVAISNQRILSVGDDHVRFLTKDGNSVTLTPEQFIQRFLLHVLPARFVKIRHYGLMAPANATTRLEIARRILRPSVRVPPALALVILAALTAANLAGPRDWRRRLKLQSVRTWPNTRYSA